MRRGVLIAAILFVGIYAATTWISESPPATREPQHPSDGRQSPPVSRAPIFDVYSQQFAITLKSMGYPYPDALAHDLSVAVMDMVNSGVIPDDGYNAVMKIITNSRIKPTATRRLLSIAQGIAIARGQTITYSTDELVFAFTGNMDRMIQFLLRVAPSTVTADDIGRWREMAREGKSSDVYADGVARLEKNFSLEKLLPR